MVRPIPFFGKWVGKGARISIGHWVLLFFFPFEFVFFDGFVGGTTLESCSFLLARGAGRGKKTTPPFFSAPFFFRTVTIKRGFFPFFFFGRGGGKARLQTISSSFPPLVCFLRTRRARRSASFFFFSFPVDGTFATSMAGAHFLFFFLFGVFASPRLLDRACEAIGLPFFPLSAPTTERQGAAGGPLFLLTSTPHSGRPGVPFFFWGFANKPQRVLFFFSRAFFLQLIFLSPGSTHRGRPLFSRGGESVPFFFFFFSFPRRVKREVPPPPPFFFPFSSLSGFCKTRSGGDFWFSPLRVSLLIEPHPFTFFFFLNFSV